MKKILLALLILFTASLAYSQKTNQPKAKAIQKTVASPLKNSIDSASYAIGLSVVNFYKQQGITNINDKLVTLAIKDIQAGKKALLDETAANQAIMSCISKQQDAKSRPTISAGETFLAANKTKPGVITTASGLQYEVITQGTGAKPVLTDTVVCHYRGTFLNGQVFDESYSRGTPIEFPLTGVIKGWTEVLQLMPVGSKYKVWVPYQLGYGSSDYGPIPGGSMLTFEIELLNIKGKG
jgi:FKBP-type peptidyl-prolyl cis-trans isomerase